MDNQLKEFLKIEKGRVPIYLQTYRKLRKLIVDGYFKYGEKITSEQELAAIMDVGRTSLRTALVLLYEDGYIVTKQGKGSFVTYDKSKSERYVSSYLPLKKRLEISYDDIVVKEFFKREITGDAFLDEKLSANGAAIHCFADVYFSSNIPIVYSQVFFSGDGISTGKDLEQLFSDNAVFVNSTFTVTSIKNLGYAPPQFKAVTNVLLVSSTWYDESGKAVAYAKDYFNNDEYKYKIGQSVL